MNSSSALSTQTVSNNKLLKNKQLISLLAQTYTLSTPEVLYIIEIIDSYQWQAADVD